MQYMTYNYFNEIHDTYLKVCGHIYNDFAVPGRVGME